MHRHPLRLAPFAVAVLLLPRLAHAQAAAATESISAAVANPERYLYQGGVCSSCTATDVTSSPRPQNLNPEGVSFSDCEQNLRMDFTLVLSGFSGADQASVQAWAGTTDCTQDSSRVSTAGTAHACWQVAGFYGPVLATTPQTVSISVYARDVLRYEAAPSGVSVAQPYDPAFNSSAAGESACHVQPTDAAVALTLYFIPVNATANAIGTSYQYALSTDLVAPSPPCNVTVQGGGALLDVAWSAPDGDPDRAGFTLWTTAAGEAGCEAIAGNGFFVTGGSTELPCHRQGISQPSQALLAGTVDDPTATSFTQTGLHGDERYAVSVASIDGTGNVGPLSTTSCAETGEEAAGGGSTKVTAGCGCAAAGSASAGAGAFAFAALALTCARRRRARA
jgi:hypothetical protein